jgi:ABC-2 type transport system ATP-binding protein
MSKTVLAVEGLVKDYNTFRAVDSISFTIEKGQVLGLLGPNGAGKSTTIQMLIGVTLPTAGNIRYFGQDFARHRRECLHRLNYASAYNALQQYITVQENLSVFAALYGVANPRDKIAGLMDYFGVRRLGKRHYKDLSAGERTRVNLVKALLNDPELILMDEPTASLDPDIADKTLGLIEQMRRDRQLSILFTSHNMEEVARLCDNVIFLDRGQIVAQDTPANHMKRLDRAEVALGFSGSQNKIEHIVRKQQGTVVFTNGIARISLPGKRIPALLAAIHEAQIAVRDIDIKKPTLEDVFLDIARRRP